VVLGSGTGFFSSLLEELVATYEARADEAQRALSPPKAEDYEYKD
jgi:hypothetical protein